MRELEKHLKQQLDEQLLEIENIVKHDTKNNKKIIEESNKFFEETGGLKVPQYTLMPALGT